MPKTTCGQKGMRGIVFLLIFILMFGVFVRNADASDHMEGVAPSSEVLVLDPGVIFWVYENEFFSALLDEEGNVYDFVKEGTARSDIRTIAISGNDLYVNSDDAVVRMNLADKEEGYTVLLDDNLVEQFFIRENEMYFMKGYRLYRMSVQGGEKEEIRRNVYRFIVTDQEIYLSDCDGGIFRMDYDGSGETQIADTAESTRIAIAGDLLYFWEEESDELGYYSLLNGKTGSMSLGMQQVSYSVPWLVDDLLAVYCAESRKVRLFDYSGTAVRETTESIILPRKDEGCAYKDKIYYVSSDQLYAADIMKDEKQGYAFLEEIQSGEAENKDEQKSEDNSREANLTGYDIGGNIALYASEGNAILENEYFFLYLPADLQWDYKVVDENTLTFTYLPAADSGYGGTFLSLRAYDWGDNSYEEIPAYHIAGVSADKKYIAILPTDVQYDTGNAQQTEEYQRLLAVADRINNEESAAQNNPFYIK